MDALHNNHTSESQSSLNLPLPRKIAITAYRLIFTVTIIGLGSWKIAASSKGQAITTNILDGVIGITLTLVYFDVVLLCVVTLTYNCSFFWLNECSDLPSLTWLFKTDRTDQIVKLLRAICKLTRVNMEIPTMFTSSVFICFLLFLDFGASNAFGFFMMQMLECSEIVSSSAISHSIIGIFCGSLILQIVLKISFSRWIRVRDSNAVMPIILQYFFVQQQYGPLWFDFSVFFVCLMLAVLGGPISQVFSDLRCTEDLES